MSDKLELVGCPIRKLSQYQRQAEAYRTLMTELQGSAVEPREIKHQDDFTLRITWADGRECTYRAATLRRACPCAQCVNEWTGERVLKPDTIDEELEIGDISVVGRYALNFRWSDGHETGIYSFRYLRELCGSK